MLFIFYGKLVFAPMCTIAELVVEPLSASYSPRVRLADVDGELSFEMLATLVEPLRLAAGKSIPAGVKFPSSTHVTHSAVPLIILFTVLFAWPVDRWMQRLKLFLVGLPAAVLLFGLTTPFQLAGLFEVGVQDALLTLGETPQPSWILRWMLFNEGGGRWLLPILVAFVCIILVAGRGQREQHEKSDSP